MDEESNKSDSERHKDLEKDTSGPSEKYGRYKMRKHATRQAFQERRKLGSAANNNLGFELGADDRAFSISSESNTSQTELQGCTIKTEYSFHGINGCSIWTESQLRNAIEDMMSSQQLSAAAIRRTKMILESNEPSNWGKISPDFLDIAVLHACLVGNSAMLSAILENGADANATDAENRTAMHYAASSNVPEASKCIALLKRQGANVNLWDKLGLATPLMCATASGHVQAAAALLQAGADINAGLADPRYPDGATALLWAIRARNPQCASLLMENGAAVNSPQAYSEAPIHVASLQGDDDCLSLLLQHQADVRVLLGRDRMSALHLAAEEGNAGCIRLLLKAKADPNVVNARGQTPLHLASLSQSSESVSILLEAGARHDICDIDLKSPLHCAVIKSSRSSDIVRLLIASGANVNASDNFGYAPLHLAAINENSKVAAILVQSGGDLSAKTKGGISALNFLVRRTPDVLATIPRRLDSAVVVADHDPLDPDCELHLDFRVLVPGGDQHRVGETNLLVTLTEAGQRHILQHPIIRAFLHLKWFKIRSLFIVSLLFHAAFVFLITANILSRYVINDTGYHANNDTGNDAINDSGNQVTIRIIINNHTLNHTISTINQESGQNNTNNCCYDPLPQEWVDAFQYVTLAFCAISAVKEFFQLLQAPIEYVKTPENGIQCFIIACVVLVNLPDDWNHGDWKHHVAAVLIVIAWMELMMHVGRFPVFGLYVQMFTTVAANIAKFLTAYLSLIIGFSLGFAVLRPRTQALAKLPFSLLTTFVMMTGELEYKDYFTDDNGELKYTGTTHLVFLAFLLFIVVVLMNLLVGLAVSDIQGLQKSAGLDRLVRQTQLIARMESIVFSPWLNQLTCKTYATTRKILQRELLVVPPTSKRVYTMKPNDPRDDRFPPDIKEGILKILVNNKAARKGHHVIHRTNTNMTNMTTGSHNIEMFDELIYGVNHSISQLAQVSTTVQDRLAKMENQLTSTQKQLDLLLALISNEPLPNGSSIRKNTQ